MTHRPEALDKFQRRISYFFEDRSLLVLALTHRSFGHKNNERLEYLGDSILGFVIAEALYRRFSTLSEGDLTKMRSRLVRGQTLSSIARELEFGEMILLGSGELKSGGADRDSILADAFEAVIGGIYLDGGMESARAYVLARFQTLLDTISPKQLKDSKTRLQEMLQKRGLPLPTYAVLGQTGEQHNLIFTVSCTITEPAGSFEATGSSRRLAEQKAAQLALSALD